MTVDTPTAADLILRRLEEVKALLDEIKHHAEQMQAAGGRDDDER